MTERSGLIQELFLTNKRGKVKALILICDTPGELLTQDREIRGVDYQWHMERVLNSDALMYILDERGQSTESSWLSDIITYTAEDHPIAIVMTKTDKLKAECRENDGRFGEKTQEFLQKSISRNRKRRNQQGSMRKQSICWWIKKSSGLLHRKLHVLWMRKRRM